MARYCFAERRQEVFTHLLARGYLAGLLDFPRFKPMGECVPLAQAALEDVRGEVCCIEDEPFYANLMRAAWLTGYQSATTDRERDIAQLKTMCKRLPTSEALRVLENAFQGEAGRAMVEKIYADCCATLRYFALHPEVYVEMSKRSAAGL